MLLDKILDKSKPFDLGHKKTIKKALESGKNIPDEVMENTSVNFDAELNLLKGNFEKVYDV